MKKFIAIMMVIAMVAAFVPTSLAKETNTNTATVDKSQFNTIERPQFYGVDNYGNKIAAGSSTVAKEVDVNTVTNTVSAKSDTKDGGFADAPHYGVTFFDQSESLTYGYQFENSDFFGATDFDSQKAKTYNMFFSPAEGNADLLENTKIATFKKGDKFWFNFDIISGWSSTAGPLHYLDKDGNEAQIPFAIYMYSGSAAQWDSEVGVASLKLTGCFDGLTRISKEIVAPSDNTVYVFAIVIYDSVVTEYNIRGFNGWLSISDYEKTYKELKVDSKIEINKRYSADLGNAETALLYGDDIGYVLANAKMYEVQLKGGEQLAITAEGDGKIGGRVFFLDENKDLITGNYLGTGAVSSQDDYQTLSWPVFPSVDGTYYIVIAGFMYTDEGIMDFELVEYSEAQSASPEILPYLPNVDVDIDLETLGADDVIEYVDGEAVWGYFYSADVQLGILVLAFPGTYHITGDNQNVFADIYDGVVMDLKNATIGSTIVNPTYAPSTINSVGKSKITDNFYGVAVANWDSCYSAVYFTGEELEVAGEKNNAVLLQNPVHVLTKKFVASAKDVQGNFTVALWTKDGINHPKLTLGSNAKVTDDRNATLKVTSMYYDKDCYYHCGYTISQYASVIRYNGSPDFYQIAGSIVITTEGTPTPGPGPDDPTPPGPDDPKPLLGDANCDGNINTGDATTVLKHAAQMITLEGQGLINADINQDNNVNTGDATYILKVVAQIIPNPND